MVNIVLPMECMLTKIMTFVIERMDNSDRVWLCANDLFTSERLAEFVSEDAAIIFSQILNIRMMQSHAQGQLGI